MKSVVLKWFDNLGFPAQWRNEISNMADLAAKKGLSADNPQDFLIKALYDCQALSDFYKEKGISEDVLYHTLSDLLIWAKNYNLMTGKLGIDEYYWIGCHLSGRLYRLGRLQFCKGVMESDCARLNLKKGDSIIEIHIPQGESFNTENCKQSISRAVEFFEKFFPEYEYSWFTCHSWLLDKELRTYLNPESNIIKFQNLFDVFEYTESDQAIKYLFDINSKKNAQNSLQKMVLEHKNNGGKLYEGYGAIAKKDYNEYRI